MYSYNKLKGYYVVIFCLPLIVFIHLIILNVFSFFRAGLAVNPVECKYLIIVTLSVKKWDQLNVFYKTIMIPQSLCASLKHSCNYVFNGPL